MTTVNIKCVFFLQEGNNVTEASLIVSSNKLNLVMSAPLFPYVYAISFLLFLLIAIMHH